MGDGGEKGARRVTPPAEMATPLPVWTEREMEERQQHEPDLLTLDAWLAAALAGVDAPPACHEGDEALGRAKERGATLPTVQ